MERVREATLQDAFHGRVLRTIEQTTEVDLSSMTKKEREALDNYVSMNGCLYKVEQVYKGGRAHEGRARFLLYIPKELRTEILFSHHDHLLSGHLGVQKTYEKLRLRYYWPRLFKTVEEWVRSCPDCQTRKNPAAMRAPVTPLPIPAEPFDMVSVDVLGPFREARLTGNRYIAIYCDHLTRWVEAVPFRRNTSGTIARMLVERICCRHGTPRVLLSDRGAPFLSELAHEVYRIMKVKKVSTASYNPQGNGLVEKFNRVIASMLSMYVDSKHTDWDVFVPYVVAAYNMTPHTSTKMSPFYMLYGREARLPVDVALRPRQPLEAPDMEEYRRELVEGLRIAHECGREALRKSQQQREARMENGKNVPVFQEGDQVMVKTPALQSAGPTKKLLHLWQGPFRVLRRMGHNTYQVSEVDGEGRAVNVRRMKRYYQMQHPSAEDTDYASYLADSGEAEAGEGNRTREPRKGIARGRRIGTALESSDEE